LININLTYITLLFTINNLPAYMVVKFVANFIMPLDLLVSKTILF